MNLSLLMLPFNAHIFSMCNYIIWYMYIYFLTMTVIKFYNYIHVHKYWLKISIYLCIHSTTCITFVLFWYHVVGCVFLGIIYKTSILFIIILLTIPLVNDLFMHLFSGVGLFILCYKELSLFSFYSYWFYN